MEKVLVKKLLVLFILSYFLQLNLFLKMQV
jgi:hypothetical protein